MWVRETFEEEELGHRVSHMALGAYQHQRFPGEAWFPQGLTGQGQAPEAEGPDIVAVGLFPSKQWHALVLPWPCPVSLEEQKHAAFMGISTYSVSVIQCHRQKQLRPVSPAACLRWSWCAQLLPETNS